MSAYIVNKRHIDALVTAALSLPRPGSQMRWLDPGEPEETDYQRGEPWGETAVATYRTRVRYMTAENATHVGRLLLLENMRSVSHRYDEPLELPAYDYTAYRPSLTPVQVLKALDGFEYQACEHPGWKNSEAYAFCEALRGEAIRQLPGYDEAAWEISEEI